MAVRKRERERERGGTHGKRNVSTLDVLTANREMDGCWVV